MTKFIVSGADLHDAVSWVARLCPTKPTVPVLQGVLVDAGERLTLSGFDFETAGEVAVSTATVTEPGRMLVPGRFLAAVAKTCVRDTAVQVGCDGSTVQVRAGRNTWKLPALPVEDYPQLPGSGSPVAAKLDGTDLHHALDRVLPTADRSGKIPILASANIICDPAGLTIVATDRYRLAVATIPAELPGDTTTELVAPLDFLGAAARGAESGPVELSTDGGVVTLATPTRRLTGRLVAGEWPRWRQLLPTDHVAEAVFVVDELTDALGRALAVADDKTPVLRLDVDPAGFVLAVTGDDRAASAPAPVSDYSGDPHTVGINPRYLRDALDGLRSDLAVMRFGPRVASLVDLVPLGDDGEPRHDYRHIIVPIKLAGAAK